MRGARLIDQTLRAERPADHEITVLENRGYAAERVSQTAIVWELPALADLAGVPIQTDVLIVAVCLVPAVHEAVIAETTGTMTSELSISWFVQAFSKSCLATFQLVSACRAAPSALPLR
jgi:hypothetical protein